MATNENAVELRSKQDVMLETKFGAKGLVLENLAQAKAFAMEIAASGIAPKGMDKPGAILLAMQIGAELGFSPMQALQNVVVVNGRATLMGTSAIALMNGSGLLEPGTKVEFGCRATTEQERMSMGALVGFCRTQRAGQAPVETLFSQTDAETAKLWNKDGPWKQYPRRMLQFRAVGFHFKDHWSDIGHGIMIDSEAKDMLRERDVTPVKPEERPRTQDPLFGDRAPEPILDAVVVDVDGELGVPEGVIDLEVDPETGEVIPPDAGVVFD